MLSIEVDVILVGFLVPLRLPPSNTLGLVPSAITISVLYLITFDVLLRNLLSLPL